MPFALLNLTWRDGDRSAAKYRQLLLVLLKKRIGIKSIYAGVGNHSQTWHASAIQN